MMVSQKPQLCAVPNDDHVNVDRAGTFSDKNSGAVDAAEIKRGQGELPLFGFGLPVAAKLVQAATSWSESVSSAALNAVDWLPNW